MVLLLILIALVLALTGYMDPARLLLIVAIIILLLSAFSR